MKKFNELVESIVTEKKTKAKITKYDYYAIGPSDTKEFKPKVMKYIAPLVDKGRKIVADFVNKNDMRKIVNDDRANIDYDDKQRIYDTVCYGPHAGDMNDNNPHIGTSSFEGSLSDLEFAYIGVLGKIPSDWKFRNGKDYHKFNIRFADEKSTVILQNMENPRYMKSYIIKKHPEVEETHAINAIT